MEVLLTKPVVVTLAVIGAVLATAASYLQTRGYLTEAEAFEGYSKAHGEAFAYVRPVNTTVLVSLLDPRWLLEIEVEAVVTAPA